MESTEYSTTPSAPSEAEAHSESGQEWAQQNGVHLTESGLPSMAYDSPSVLGHDEATGTSTEQKGETGPTDRARQYAHQLAATLSDLDRSLDETEVERAQFVQERDSLQEQINGLQQDRATKDHFVETLRQGSAGSMSDEDLEAIRGMMDALTQDPDRLTVLFTVVQQASKLAAVVTDYASLRRMVEQG
jgi:hypothetical protein